MSEIASRNPQIAETMTAITIVGDGGGPEVLVPHEIATPKPGAGEVLLRVHAAGVNRPDVMQRAGMYPPPAGAPDTPGLEIAGEVVAIGEGVDRALLGSRQCALVAGGGYAQYCLAKADHCLSVPDGLAMEEAAALPETLFTVWSNVFERGMADEGDWLLVHGGTSGIGTMAIKLAGAVRRDHHRDLRQRREMRGCACRWARIMRSTTRPSDFVEEVQRITDGRGVDVVLDMISGDYVARNIACMAEDARHVTIAVQGGVKAEIPMHKVLTRRLTLTGSTLRPRTDRFKAAVADEIRREVWPFVASGQLRPAMDSTFPLDRAADAHRRMDEDHIGKIVLTVA